MQERYDWVLPDGARVPATIAFAERAKALLLIAPHSSAGIERPFTTEVASMLAARGITCARFDFPFMHTFSKRPDSPNVLARIVHGVAGLAREHAPGLPFFLGGSSFGARVVATTQTKHPVPDVRGMVLMGFPLHPVDRPSTDNARFFCKIPLPLLFVQGIGDAAAHEEQLHEAVRNLPKASVTWVETNDGSLRSIAKRETRSGGSGVQATCTAIVDWVDAVLEDRLAQVHVEPQDPRLARFEALVARAEELVEQQVQRIDRMPRGGGTTTMALQVLQTWRESLELIRWKRDFLRWSLSNGDLDIRIAQPSLLENAPPTVREALASELGSAASGHDLFGTEFNEAVERAVFRRYA